MLSYRFSKLFYVSKEQPVGKTCLLLALLWVAGGHPLALADLPPARKIPVALTFDDPKAKTVAVAGSFDPGWQRLHSMKRDATGRWTTVLELVPGRYEFQFLVDGRWRHDPRLPSVEDSFGGRNNVLVVPFP